MPIDSVQKCTDNVTPSSNDIVRLHEIEWDNGQKDPGIAWKCGKRDCKLSVCNYSEIESWKSNEANEADGMT